MAFNPQATYRGGDYLFAGISGAGKSLGEALSQYEEDKAKVGFADTVVDFASKQFPGSIPAEALKRYHQANAKEKAYIALGAGQNIANVLKQQENTGQYRKNLAEANYYTLHGASLGDPTQTTEPETREIDTPQGKRTVFRSGKNSWAVVPGTAGDDSVDLDEQGNPIYTPDKAMFRSQGNWKPVTEPMRKSIEDFEATKQAQAEAQKQTGQQQGPNIFQRNFPGLFGPGPTPQPIPPAAPTPTIRAPAAQGGSVTRSSGSTDKIAAAAQIKAQFKSGAITQDEAVKQLQALGLK